MVIYWRQTTEGIFALLKCFLFCFCNVAFKTAKHRLNQMWLSVSLSILSGWCSFGKEGMFLSTSEWDWSLREDWQIHCLLLQWNLGIQVECNIRALLSQAVLSLSRMMIIRFMAPTSPFSCKFGVWSKKGASFFVIQNTEKEMPDPFTTSRGCLCQQSTNATRFKHLLSVRSNLCTAMATLISGSCFTQRETHIQRSSWNLTSFWRIEFRLI